MILDASEVTRLRDMVKADGLSNTAKALHVSAATLTKATSGFEVREATAELIRQRLRVLAEVFP